MLTKWLAILSRKGVSRIDAIDHYLFPLLIGGSLKHWTLIVAETKDKMFYIVDSLQQIQQAHINFIKNLGIFNRYWKPYKDMICK